MDIQNEYPNDWNSITIHSICRRILYLFSLHVTFPKICVIINISRRVRSRCSRGKRSLLSKIIYRARFLAKHRIIQEFDDCIFSSDIRERERGRDKFLARLSTCVTPAGMRSVINLSHKRARDPLESRYFSHRPKRPRIR